jgi:hypothetical protein
MKSEYTTNLLLVILFIGILFFSVLAFYLHSSFSFFSLFFFILIGFLIFKTQRTFFIYSYFLNIICFSIIVYSNFSINGTYFLGGGDDELFFDYAIRMSKYGIEDFGIEYVFGMPFKLYTHIQALYFDFLKILGFCDYSLIHLLLINSFVGACTAVLIAKFISFFKLEDSKKNLLTLITISFPISIFYYSNLLRECFVVLIFMLVVYITTNYKLKVSKKIFFVIVLIISAFFIRPASSFFIMSFPFFFIIFNSASFYKKILIYSFLFVGILVLLKLRTQIYNRDVQETSEMYQELASETADDQSLGIQLMQSSNPFLKACSVFYIVLSPIPPLIIKELSFRALIFSIGSLLFYFTFPAFILLVFSKNYEKRKIIIPFFLTFVFTSVIVTFTSADPRHLQLIMPITFFLGVYYIFLNSNRYMNFLKYYFLIGSLAFTAYIFIKVL